MIDFVTKRTSPNDQTCATLCADSAFYGTQYSEEVRPYALVSQCCEFADKDRCWTKRAVIGQYRALYVGFQRPRP